MSDPELSGALQWHGELPSGSFGIASIRMTLELMLHVRLRSPEHFDAAVASVRELSQRAADLLAELKEMGDGSDVDDDGTIHGDRAQQCWRARIDHRSWDDLLFLLSKYGVIEPEPDEQERWDEALESESLSSMRELRDKVLRELTDKEERRP